MQTNNHERRRAVFGRKSRKRWRRELVLEPQSCTSCGREEMLSTAGGNLYCIESREWTTIGKGGPSS